MKLEKQKAEAYVRSKCPELMELSFGCEVQLDNSPMTDVIIGTADIGACHSGYWEYRLRSGSLAHTDNRGGRDCRYLKDYRIIGHPIQLSHYNKVVIATAKWKGSELVKQAQVFWNMNMYWECEDWNNFYRYVCEQLEI